MIRLFAVPLVLAFGLYAQVVPAGPSTTKGPCSPAVSGSRNTITIECNGISQNQADQFLKILNKIAQSQIPADRVFEKLDDIEKAMRVFADDLLVDSQMTMMLEFEINPSDAVTGYIRRVARNFPERAGSGFIPLGDPASPSPGETAELPLLTLANGTTIGLWAFKDPPSLVDKADPRKADFWALNECAFEPVRRKSENDYMFEFLISDGRLSAQCYSSKLVLYRNNPRLRTFSDLVGFEVYISLAKAPPITPTDVLLGNNGRVIKLANFRPAPSAWPNVFSTVVSKADLEPPH